MVVYICISPKLPTIPGDKDNIDEEIEVNSDRNTTDVVSV